MHLYIFIYVYIHTYIYKILSSRRGCVLKRVLGTMRINKQIENEMRGLSLQMCAHFRAPVCAKINSVRNKHRFT